MSQTAGLVAGVELRSSGSERWGVPGEADGESGEEVEEEWGEGTDYGGAGCLDAFAYACRGRGGARARCSKREGRSGYRRGCGRTSGS